MKIVASEVAFASSHHTSSSVSSKLEITVTSPPAQTDTVSLSDSGKAAAATEASLDDPALPPRLAFIKQVLEAFFGHEIELGTGLKRFKPDDAAAAPSSSPAPATTTSDRAATPAHGLEVHYSEHREESEQLQVVAQGRVQTADGRSISFDLGLSLSRSFTQDLDLNIKTGKMEPRKKDPLVINFNGTAAELGSGKFSFDIDQDGKLDAMPTLAGGSSFLVLDKNRDGVINNGGELFGAKSGDGFADLSAYDDDHNGWIDENDAVYQRLGVWQPDSAGKGAIRSLVAADVGAIHLGRVASAYEYRDGANTPTAALRSTGVFLHESGTAGTVQQLDVYV